MKFGSLFAGIGGFDLGLERAGMECAWQVEIDPFCQQVLAKHWPDVERYADVRDCGKHNLKPVDLICGGFPCQPHSVAGKRRGAADDRDLWPEYRRIIDELKPDWVLAENVPGIRTTILDQVLSDLEGMDYTVGTLVVPACAFDAPHRRERIFVVAHAAQSGQLREKQLENDSGCQRGRQVADDADAQGEVRSQDVTHASSKGLAQRESQSGNYGTQQPPAFRTDWWAVEPPVGRVAHGIPRRVDRLRALGNAVVPQVVTWIGSMIMELETS